jgi:2-phospho-L-lactate guanylyltransferase
VIHQAEDKGTAAAFAHAVGVLLDTARRRRPRQLLMIAGDLPLVSPALLSTLVRQCAGSDGVSILPDRKRIGTNALFCSPPDAIPPCFGKDSFSRHLSAARERGIPVLVMESEPLSLDIDVAEDLALLRMHPLDASDPVADIALRELLASLRPELLPTEQENFHDARPI